MELFSTLAAQYPLDPGAESNLTEDLCLKNNNGHFTGSWSVYILPDEEIRRYSEERIKCERRPVEEHQESLCLFSKVLTAKELASLSHLKDENLKIGLVSGSFDLIHLGHVRHINAAKNLCDVLVVATMSTSSLKQQEKNVHGDRPIYSQNDRITVLSALRTVDHVTIFDERDCKEVIKTLQPQIYFKHIKDMERKIVREECDLVRSLGGEVRCHSRLRRLLLH